MRQTQKAPPSDSAQGSVNSTAAGSLSPCIRCGGLMVVEVCIELASNLGEAECYARRCVQCGDVIDSVIARHRRLAQASSSAGPPAIGTLSPTTLVAA